MIGDRAHASKVHGATIDVNAFNEQLLCCGIAVIDEGDHCLLCGIKLRERWY